jgi:hypothetical protein
MKIPRVVFILTTMAALLPTGLRSQTSAENKPLHKGVPESALPPIVDFESTRAEWNVRALRTADRYRGLGVSEAEPHGRQGFVIEDNPGDILPLPMTTHWWYGLAAIPAARSDLIVIGTVAVAEAKLPPDRSAIFSEFTIRVTNALKRDGPGPTPSTIVADRWGGRVRFASGKVEAFTVSGRAYPKTGQRYLFFLKNNGYELDYDIVTAYALADGHVQALDGAGFGASNPLQFDKYDGVDENEFIKLVRAAIDDHDNHEAPQ